MSAHFPIKLQQPLSNQQYLQSDLRSAVVAIQSLVNQNNSRFETLARETHAAVAGMSMSDHGENRNMNYMTTMEMNERPSDSERRIGVEEIPPGEQRRRTSVTWDNQPNASNIKVFDPASKVQQSTNGVRAYGQPLRSNLKTNNDPNTQFYVKPASRLQLNVNDTNPEEQRRLSDAGINRTQLFENPTSMIPMNDKDPMEQRRPVGSTAESQVKPGRGRLNGVDTKSANNDNTTGQAFSYKEQVLVEVKVVFVRVMEIDTISQQFEAEIYIQARWTESQFSGYSEEELQEIEFRQCWNPMLTILNTVGFLESDRASMLLRYEPDRVYPILTYMWHVRGLFREIMELQHFPFDVQEISVVISSERGIRELELVTDYTQLSNVSPRAMQGNQEWTGYRHVEFTRDYNTLETVSTTKHPILVAAAHTKRKLGFYFWNVCIIVLLILALSVATLGIAPYLEDRLMVTTTLFLTCIVFKLVVKTTLPNISYLTYLDMYVIFALVYLTLQGIENAIMIHLKKFKSSSRIEVYDEIAQGCLIALLVIFHLVLIIYIQVTAFSRRRSMSDKELDFEVTKINLQRKAAEDMAKASKEKAELTGKDANPLFKQTQTSSTLLLPLGNQQEPIEVTNPLFREQ